MNSHIRIQYYPGRPESRADKLRSIVAQMEFANKLDYWDKKGVPFTQYLYVPEIHPVTLATFHEREDEGHVFKVMFQTFKVHTQL